MRPPPTSSTASGTLHWTPSNRMVASTRSSGSRCLSHGPGRALRTSMCASHTVAPGSGATGLPAACGSGPAFSSPLNIVCGAPGHRRAASTLARSALALMIGWDAQGAMSARIAARIGLEAVAVALAPGEAEREAGPEAEPELAAAPGDGADPASSCSGRKAAATCNRAPAPASVPVAVASARTVRGAMPLGTGARTRPFNVAAIAIGALPCNVRWAL